MTNLRAFTAAMLLLPAAAWAGDCAHGPCAGGDAGRMAAFVEAVARQAGPMPAGSGCLVDAAVHPFLLAPEAAAQPAAAAAVNGMFLRAQPLGAGAFPLRADPWGLSGSVTVESTVAATAPATTGAAVEAVAAPF